MIRRFRQLLTGLWGHPVRALLALLLLGLIGWTGYSGGWDLWARFHLWQAQRALAQGDLPRARASLEVCLRVRPNSAAFHCLAAQVARRRGAYDEAEWHLGECRRLQGPAEAIDLEGALLCAQRGDLARVESRLWAAIRKDHPETPLILEALTKGYAQTYRMPQALNCVQGWLERQPDNVQAVCWRGLIWERLYHFQEALEDYRRVVDLDPEEDQARVHLAERLLEAGQAAEALEHFQRVAQRQPENAAAHLGVARSQIDLGRYEEARHGLDDLLSERPEDGLVLIERGKVALLTNEPAEAETWLRKALAVLPYERSANYYLYQCLERLGRPKEAERYLAEAERIATDMERLVQATQKMTTASPDPSLCCEVGKILLRNGQAEQGLRWLGNALQEDPRHQPAHQALADYYERTGNAALAARHRQLALDGGGNVPGKNASQ